MSNTIRISDKVELLTGEGLEFLVKGDTVIAKFFNGNLFFDPQEVSNQEKTIAPSG